MPRGHRRAGRSAGVTAGSAGFSTAPAKATRRGHRSQIPNPKGLGGVTLQISDFGFQISWDLKAENSRKSRNQKRAETNSWDLGRFLGMSDFRFQISDFPRGPAKSHGQNQISDFRFQISLGARPNPMGRIRFQISDFKGAGGRFLRRSDFRLQISSRARAARARALQISDFRFPAPPDTKGLRSIRSRMQISDFSLQKPPRSMKSGYGGW